MLRAAVAVGATALAWGCGTLVGFDKDYHEVPNDGGSGSETAPIGSTDASHVDAGTDGLDAGPDGCTIQGNRCTSSAECCPATGVAIVCMTGRKQCALCLSSSSSNNCNASADCCPNVAYCHANGRCDSQPCADAGGSCAGGGNTCCVGLACFPSLQCQACVPDHQSPGDAGHSVCCGGRVDDAGLCNSND